MLLISISDVPINRHRESVFFGVSALVSDRSKMPVMTDPIPILFKQI